MAEPGEKLPLINEEPVARKRASYAHNGPESVENGWVAENWCVKKKLEWKARQVLIE